MRKTKLGINIFIQYKKKFGLFDNMEMIDHSDIHKAFIFITNIFSISDFEHLVSSFCPIFGNDMMRRGKFNHEDENQIVSQNSWFGRMWSDNEKYNCAVTISIDIESLY